MRKLAGFLLILLILQPLNALMAQRNEPTVVATIAGEPITDRDIVHYARRMPYMVGYLSVPGGPMRIMDNMIKERLLILEGQRQGIRQPGPNEGGESAYILKVRNRLVKPCPQPTEETARAFYEAHPELFSTPLYLRLRRIGLEVTPATEDEVWQALEQLRRQIESGQISFAEAAAQVSEDPLGQGRQGDIGFIPADDPDNPIMDLLKEAKPGQVIGPIPQPDMFFLYQVTDRREPILEPYASAREQAFQLQLQTCKQQALDEVFAELKRRWPVKILVTDIPVEP